MKKLKDGKDSEKIKRENLFPGICSVCESPLEEENGDVAGHFGILPIGFCVWCLSSVTDMVVQLQGFDDIDVLEERIIALGQEQNQGD